MIKIKKQKNEKNREEADGVTINLKKSSVAEFTQRPVPTEQQVEEFDDFIEDETLEEEIDESLNEIYQDEAGKLVDVKKLYHQTKRGFFYWLLVSFALVAGFAGISYFLYNNFYLSSGSDATALEFKITGETEVVAGQEFFYTISYQNLSNINLKNALLEVSLPDNFVLLDSYPEADSENNNIWEIQHIPAESSNSIKIKGMIIAPKNDTGIALAKLRYTPENFSSEFKKESALTTTVKDVGVDIEIDFIKSVLVGMDNSLSFIFKTKENNYINDFKLNIEPAENITFRVGAEDDRDNLAEFSEINPHSWQIKNLNENEVIFPVYSNFLKKLSASQVLKVSLSKIIEENKYAIFYEKEIEFEVMKNDLNLTLIINGSRENTGVNFTDTLNYSLVYKNKGETEMKDVILMAVLDSDFLDWTTLDETMGGKRNDNTITWTKTQISDLEVLAQHGEGIIDFSIEVMDVDEVEAGLDYKITSYAQFNVGEIGEGDEASIETEDNRSNTIVNTINSDLKVVEEIRYFNEDNITVGNGPLPLRVGEKTSFKIYWTLTNNLHELNNAKVEVSLPDYIEFDNKNRTNVGTIEYDNVNRRVAWNIGRLPTSVFRADAEFNISVVPQEDDRNKIIVLKPGAKVSAFDTVTNTEISKITDVKTSKLEDDDIAQKSNDGIVR